MPNNHSCDLLAFCAIMMSRHHSPQDHCYGTSARRYLFSQRDRAVLSANPNSAAIALFNSGDSHYLITGLPIDFLSNDRFSLFSSVLIKPSLPIGLPPASSFLIVFKSSSSSLLWRYSRQLSIISNNTLSFFTRGSNFLSPIWYCALEYSYFHGSLTILALTGFRSTYLIAASRY